MDNMHSGEERTAAKRVLEGFLLAFDIILYLVKSIILYLYGIYKLFVPPEEKSVSGELVLITGTGHGIGKELARQYGELGARVICVDINKNTNKETVDALKKLKIDAYNYSCDVSSRESVLELGKRIREEIGDVTILVNNAGIMPCKPLLSHKPEEIRKMFDINVFAHFWMLEAFLPAMIKNNKGHVVGISSVAGIVGNPNVVPYCASKFAVRGLMEALSEEMRKDDVKVKMTTIYPYITDTGLCKNPKIRFSNWMRILSPAETASQIISAQRRGYVEATVPPYMFFTNVYARNLPVGCRHLLLDFLNAGLDPDV